MKKMIFIIIIFSCLAVMASLTFGFKGGNVFMGPREGKIDNLITLSRLNLTHEQKAKLHDLRMSHLKKIKPLLDKVYSKRGDLKLLWLDKKSNQTKILKTQKDISNLDSQIQEQVSVYELSVLKELTPEQQEKVRCHMGAHQVRFPYGDIHHFGPPQGADHFFAPPPHKRFGCCYHLHLSKEQLDSMHDSQRRFSEETKDLRNNFAIKYREMVTLFQDPKTDDTTLLAKQKDIITLQQQLADKKMEMIMRDRKILTPEQIEKFEPMILDRDLWADPSGTGLMMMERNIGRHRDNQAVMDHSR